jgi:hypothetical protein
MFSSYTRLGVSSRIRRLLLVLVLALVLVLVWVLLPPTHRASLIPAGPNCSTAEPGRQMHGRRVRLRLRCRLLFAAHHHLRRSFRFLVPCVTLRR